MFLKLNGNQKRGDTLIGSSGWWFQSGKGLFSFESTPEPETDILISFFSFAHRFLGVGQPAHSLLIVYQYGL